MSRYSFKWIIQRITSVLLIPLTFWFVYNCILFSKVEFNQLTNFFSSYLNSLLFLGLMISMLVHARLGCETIIEDYISSSSLKSVSIIFARIMFNTAMLVTVISILSILFK